MASASSRANASDAPFLPGPSSFRFSTDALPEAERIEIFREDFGRKMFRLDMEPLPDRRFHTEAIMRSLPGLDAVWSESSALRVSRTRQLLSDGNGNLVFQWANSAASCVHLGREIALQSGDAVVLTRSDIGSVRFPTATRLIALSVPRDALGSLLRDTDAVLARPFPWSSGALQLLVGYLEVLRGEATTPTPELQGLAVAHVYDLLAVTLGATKDAAEAANGRGVRAARLCALQSDIGKHLSDGDIRISVLAQRHRLTPRYVQMLFEEGGTTFTEFLRGQRLARAYRMLASRRFDHRRISDIAFDCGFGDVSYFNRTFRARYGVTPSDVRGSR